MILMGTNPAIVALQASYIYQKLVATCTSLVPTSLSSNSNPVFQQPTVERMWPLGNMGVGDARQANQWSELLGLTPSEFDLVGNECRDVSLQ